jgi:ATP-dependent exoDNAse (exonuclease V) beta subunit
VSAFNEDFAQLFPREVNASNPDDVPFVAASAARPATSGARNLVWHGNVLPQDSPEDIPGAARRNQARLDAKAIRAIIEQWRATPVPDGRTGPEPKPWKIAVLVRSRNLLSDIVTELKTAAIPYRAVDIEALGERQEVLDLFALTRALLHPADRVAWLAVLRAPWCGLGLAELHLLAGADDPAFANRSMEDVITERGHLLSEESCERLARVWTIMRAAEARRSLLTAAQCVERTWRSLGGDAYLGPEEMANAMRFLQLLDEMEQQARGMDLGMLKRRMDKLFAEAHESAGAVDLMTIHGAKGLEWDVVIVPGLEKPPRPNKRRMLSWDEIDSDDDEVARVVLAPIAGNGEGSKALNDWLNSIHRARETAEQKRLFYVACTRAKEELHLFASPKTNVQGEISLQAGSLLKTAWPAAEKYFAPQTDLPETISVDRAALTKELVFDMAASAAEVAQAAIIQRLPLAFDPRARFLSTKKRLCSYSGIQPNAAHFERPDGSFEARTFGTAVHAFLEMLARRAAEGVSTDTLLREVADWGPRIASVLRADGLPHDALERHVIEVKAALTNTLQDAHGRWVLTAQDEAASELALTGWRENRTSVRLDRAFRAGREPLAEGHECAWIVDYKTASHGRKGVEEFLEGEQAKYTAQMETYARMIQAGTETPEIRVALYYPLLPKLIWWKPVS